MTRPRGRGCREKPNVGSLVSSSAELGMPGTASSVQARLTADLKAGGSSPHRTHPWSNGGWVERLQPSLTWRWPDYLLHPRSWRPVRTAQANASRRE